MHEDIFIYGALLLGAVILVLPFIKVWQRHKMLESQKSTLLTILKQYQGYCYVRKQAGDKLLDSIGEANGNLTDTTPFLLATTHGQAGLAPVQQVHELQLLLEEKKGTKAAIAISNSYAQIKQQNTITDSAIESYKKQYAPLLEEYFQVIFTLTKLHDELSLFLQGKSLNPQGKEWVNMYFVIFKNWNDNGTSNKPKVLQQLLINNIFLLNQHFHGVAFAAQTTELAHKATVVYHQLEKLEHQLTQTIKNYVYCFKKGLKITDLISTRLATKSDMSRLPVLSPKQKQVGVIILVITGILLLGYWLIPPSEAQPSGDIEPLRAGYSLPKPAIEDRITSHRAHVTAIDSIQRHTPDAPIQHPQSVYGIDISLYQKAVDWKQIRKDTTLPVPIHFCIIKATQGLKKDPYFTHNWNGAHQTSDMVGAYHFFTFRDDPKKQAQNYIEMVPLTQGHIRPVVDIETICHKKVCTETGGYSAEELRERLRIFLFTIESHFQCKAIIYSNNSYFKKYLKGHFPDNHFWIAEYSKKEHLAQLKEAAGLTSQKQEILCWQYSGSGRVTGITGDVDLNYLPGNNRNLMLIQ